MTTQEAESLGTRLRRLRLAEGLTISELARRAEVSKSNLSRAEAGLATPSRDSLRSIAQALRKTIAEVTGNDPKQNQRKRLPIAKPTTDMLAEITSAGLAKGLDAYVVTSDVHTLYLAAGEVLIVSRDAKPENRDFLLLGDPEPLTIARLEQIRMTSTGEEFLTMAYVGGPHSPEEEGVEILGVIVEKRRSRSSLRDRWEYQRTT